MRYLIALMIATGPLLAGCAGTTSDPFADSIETPASTYSGLTGQSAAIMIWADFATRTEFNRIQVDLASAIQKQVIEPPGQKKDEKKARPPAVEFVDPRSVVRFQREHPETDGMPIVELAPRLGVPRVVYIELEDFQTQSPKSIMLLKGHAQVTLRVIEVAGGKARVAFEERSIVADYPRNAPEGMAPSDQVDPRTIYEGTVNLLARKIATRLVTAK